MPDHKKTSGFGRVLFCSLKIRFCDAYQFTTAERGEYVAARRAVRGSLARLPRLRLHCLWLGFCGMKRMAGRSSLSPETISPAREPFFAKCGHPLAVSKASSQQKKDHLFRPILRVRAGPDENKTVDHRGDRATKQAPPHGRHVVGEHCYGAIFYQGTRTDDQERGAVEIRPLAILCGVGLTQPPACFSELHYAQIS